ncbi:MAG: hypothetical protein AAF206_14210 [Bacteroidota bacterium]
MVQERSQGSNWLSASVNLNAYAGTNGVQLRFVGTTGANFLSDIAIDDIRINCSILPLAKSQTVAASATTFFPGFQNCFPLIECESENAVAGCSGPGDVVNPFLNGLRGIWRPLESHVYMNERDYDVNGANPKSDGTIPAFSPFWVNNSSGWGQKLQFTPVWRQTGKTLKVSPMGQDLESEDAMGRPSSALYAHQNQIPIATGSNAAYHQIANVNFEDQEGPSDCQRPHFEFKTTQGNAPAYEQNISHSGLYSASVAAGERLESCSSVRTDDPCAGGVGGLGKAALGEYTLQGCDCVGLFSPEPGDTMLASVWTRVNPANCGPGPIFGYPGLGVEIEVDGIVIPFLEEQRGNLVEGWQRLEYAFIIPQNASAEFKVRLLNNESAPALFDDFRIHPFLSGMRTYVFHPYTLRLMAEGDGQNYMTFYEYDENGALIRRKKETERGILTLDESRSNTRKSQP